MVNHILFALCGCVICANAPFPLEQEKFKFPFLHSVLAVITFPEKKERRMRSEGTARKGKCPNTVFLLHISLLKADLEIDCNDMLALRIFFLKK